MTIFDVVYTYLCIRLGHKKRRRKKLAWVCVVTGAHGMHRKAWGTLASRTIVRRNWYNFYRDVTTSLLIEYHTLKADSNYILVIIGTLVVPTNFF